MNTCNLTKFKCVTEDRSSNTHVQCEARPHVLL